MRNLIKSGFTFVELLIVTAIIAIFASIAIPSFRASYERFSLKISAEKMIKLIQAAHELSLLDNHTYKILISDSPSSFVLLRNSDQDPKLFDHLSGNIGKLQILGKKEIIQTNEKEIFFLPDGSSTESKLIFQNQLGDSIDLKISNSGKVIKNVQ